jgi:hypothetical protein
MSKYKNDAYVIFSHLSGMFFHPDSDSVKIFEIGAILAPIRKMMEI